MLWFILEGEVEVIKKEVFKYILCYGSSQQAVSSSASPQYLNTSYVMVHQVEKQMKSGQLQDLNTSYVMVHLFNAVNNGRLAATFKYILCYGSSSIGCCGNSPTYLNTSYVMVHLCRRRQAADGERFKYILCYGSSASCHSLFVVCFYLNTSYVMVHQIRKAKQ